VELPIEDADDYIDDVVLEVALSANPDYRSDPNKS
jgi:hypothetical protein